MRRLSATTKTTKSVSSLSSFFSSSSLRNFHFDPTTDSEYFYQKQKSSSKYGSALSKRMEATRLKDQQQSQSSAATTNTKKPLQHIVVEEPNLVEQTLPSHIRQMHDEAVARGETNYTDPDTGYFVFTRLSHMNRGKCCGSACRHCPFGHANVPAERKLFLQLQAQKNIKQNEQQQKKTSAGDVKQETKSTTLKKNSQGEEAAKKSKEVESPPPPKDLEETTTSTAPATKLTNSGQETGVVFTRTGDKGTSGLFSGERRSKSDNIFEVLGTVDELNSNIGMARVECNFYIEQELSSSTSSSNSSNSETMPPRRLFISVRQDLEWIQERLLDCGSLIAMMTAPPQEGTNNNATSDSSSSSSSSSSDLLVEQGTSDWVKRLERTIEQQTSILPPLTNFILPCGGCRASAQLHICRSVCRRAERSVWREISSEISRLKAISKKGEDDEVDLTSDHLTRCRAVAKFLNRLSDFLFTSARTYEKR